MQLLFIYFLEIRKKKRGKELISGVGKLPKSSSTDPKVHKKKENDIWPNSNHNYDGLNLDSSILNEKILWLRG